MSTRARERSRTAHNPRQGFSLIELMIAVAIVGILAAIAIPTFGTYIYRSRATEAPRFIGLIKLRQEAYRSEFGIYAEVSGPGLDPTNIDSNLNPDKGTLGPDDQAFNLGAYRWADLGAVPTGPVYFGYGVAAGMPDTAVSRAGSVGYTAANQDFWYVIQAWGDLDGDGDFVMFEAYEPTTRIHVECNGALCPKGYE